MRLIADKVQSGRLDASAAHSDSLSTDDKRAEDVPKRGPALGHCWVSRERPVHGFEPVHGCVRFVSGRYPGYDQVNWWTLRRLDLLCEGVGADKQPVVSIS